VRIKRHWDLLNTSFLLGTLGLALLLVPLEWSHARAHWGEWVVFLVMFFAIGLGVTAGYHRYFSHRAFSTSRVFQFLLAVGAQSAAQRGVLWWASHHRWHHKYSDTEKDVHSAKLRGFWYSHFGWILNDTWKTNLKLVPDLAKYPELRYLSRSGINFLPSALLGLAFLLIGGTHGLVWGYMVSTVLLWHGSFAINSLTHMFGRQRYATKDESRNNWLLAIITTGEGWHNNHHHYPGSARQGFFWWEFDLTYYVLCGLQREPGQRSLYHDCRNRDCHGTRKIFLLRFGSSSGKWLAGGWFC